MDYAALIVAGVSAIFWAGFYYGVVRGRLDKHDRDNNGLGSKMRDVAAIEARHHREILGLLVAEPVASERARILRELVERG